METIKVPQPHKKCNGTGLRDVCNICGLRSNPKNCHEHFGKSVRVMGCTAENYGRENCGATGIETMATITRTRHNPRGTRKEIRLRKQGGKK